MIHVEIPTEQDLDTLLECIKVFSDLKFNNMNVKVIHLFNIFKQAKNNIVNSRITELKKQILALERQKFEEAQKKPEVKTNEAKV